MKEERNTPNLTDDKPDDELKAIKQKISKQFYDILVKYEEEDEEEEDIDTQYDIYMLTNELQFAEAKNKKLIDEINALKAENEELRRCNERLAINHTSWKRGWIEAFEAMGWKASQLDICEDSDDLK